MDCEEFLRELKDCYRINGVEFPDDFMFFSSKFTPNPQVKRAPYRNAAHGKVPAMYRCEEKTLPENAFCYSKGKAAKEFLVTPKRKSRAFSDFRDMVYTLAWELSRKIGRLPDGLHARMVLSADGHPMVRRYIEERGV